MANTKNIANCDSYALYSQEQDHFYSTQRVLHKLHQTSASQLCRRLWTNCSNVMNVLLKCYERIGR